MKFLKCAVLICAIGVLAGCQNSYDVAEPEGIQQSETTKVSTLEADICSKCGCCADCEDCCKTDAETCSCGFKKGSPLCCVEGLSPTDGKYCKSCGFQKGSESCCAASNESCTKCGLAKGSPLCCKLPESDHGHDHVHVENGGEHGGHGEHATGEHDGEHEHDAGGKHVNGEQDSDEHDHDGEHDHEGEHVEGAGDE